MAFYSGGEVKTRVIDPVNDLSNSRSEFRLDQLGGMLSNLRLINFGLISNTNKYNGLLGAYGVIKNISLMDGSTVLSELKEASNYLGFRNLQMTNSMNESVHKFLARNQLGFYVDSDTGDAGSERTDAADTTGSESTTDKAHLDLRMCLPMLNAVQSLDNKVFPKLRLVVEYKTAAKALVEDTSQAHATTRPALLVDVIHDEGVRNSALQNYPPTATWLEVEHDNFVVPAVGVSASATHVVQNTTNKLQGFNNKNLQRLLVMKKESDIDNTFSGNTIQGYGNAGSKAQYLEKIQYRVNGRNVLAGSGAENSNERLALLCDTWGDVNIAPAANFTGGNMNDLTEDGALKTGQLDYDGVYIGEPIRDLQIEFERKGIHNGGTQLQQNNELRVDCYGEVVKTLQVKGGEYMVSYA